MAKDKPCCPDCAEKEARSAVMARYQDGGPVLPDLDRERRANFFKRTKKAVPSFQDGGQVSVQESLEAAQRRLDEERLQQRLAEASPLERNVYEVLGLEPGLDRGAFLPVAYGPGGERELATPALIYDFLKAMSAPGAALRGVPVSDQEVIETAFETMGGGTAFGPAVDGFALGMAMSPKGRVFRPKETFDVDTQAMTRRVLPELPKNMGEYYYLLRSNLEKQGVSPDVVEDILKKAEKYYSGEFGTADDRIRQRMIAGEIEPTISTRQPNTTAQTFMDAYDQVQNPGMVNLLSRALRRKSDLQELEEAYDRASGIERFQYGDVEPTGIGSNLDAIRQYQRMLDQGVEPEFITGGMEFSGTRFSPELFTTVKSIEDAPTDYGELVPGYSRTIFEDIDFPGRGAYERALEEGEIIYDIDPEFFGYSGFDFLSPARLAERLSTLPENKIKSQSFPDLVVETAVIQTPMQKRQKRLAAEVSSQAKRLEQQNPELDSSGIATLFGPKERANMVPKSAKIGPDTGATKVLTPIGEKGLSWYRLETPESLLLEGSLMNNSIAGYGLDPNYQRGGREAFRKGETQVFSLRDSEGNPVITTDVVMNTPSGPKVSDARIYNNKTVPNEYLNELFQLYDELNIDATDPSVSYVAGIDDFNGRYANYIERGSTSDVLLPEIEALRQRSAQRTGRTRGEAIENNPNIFGVNQRNNPYDPENN